MTIATQVPPKTVYLSKNPGGQCKAHSNKEFVPPDCEVQFWGLGTAACVRFEAGQWPFVGISEQEIEVPKDGKWGPYQVKPAKAAGHFNYKFECMSCSDWTKAEEKAGTDIPGPGGGKIIIDP